MAVTMKSALGTVTTPLAQELVDNILKHVEDADILALRAVSRDAREKSGDEFSRTFFTNRRQLVTKTSLQQFIDICNYSELDLIAKLESVEFVHVDIWNERERLTLPDPNYVAVALKKLKDANVLPALRIAHTGYMDGHSATRKVLEGIAQADFPVKDLTLCDWNKTESALDSLASLKDRLYSNMSDLRRLSMDGFVDEIQTTLFSEFLAAAPLLEHFTMDAEDEYAYRGLGTFAAFPRNQLTSLEIRNGEFEPGELHAFLDSQRGRLTHLELCDVTLDSVEEDDGWAPLLEKLAEHFNLDKIRLELLGGDCDDLSANGQGTAAVKSILLDLAVEARQKASIDHASGDEMDDYEMNDYGEGWDSDDYDPDDMYDDDPYYRPLGDRAYES